jgi:uncharacterized protein YraI
MTWRSRGYAGVFGALLGSAAAAATPARTLVEVNLHAGPAFAYPVVAVLVPGAAVEVQGCLPDYSWCDVVAGRDRGWVNADYLGHDDQEDGLSLHDYGAGLGIAVFSFLPQRYWHEHYRDHDFYRHRHHWLHPGPEVIVLPPAQAQPARKQRHREPAPGGPASEAQRHLQRGGPATQAHEQLQRGGPATEAQRRLEQGGAATERVRELRRDSELRERAQELRHDDAVQERLRAWRERHDD